MNSFITQFLFFKSDFGSDPIHGLIAIFAAVVIYAIWLGIKSGSSKNLNNNLSEDLEKINLKEGIVDYKKEIEEICQFVEKRLDKASNTILLDPEECKGFYEDIPDLKEKTEVLVIEYIQQLKEHDSVKSYEWSYLGFDGGYHKYLISFTGINSKALENLIEVIDYFMTYHQDGAYLFEDDFSGQWVQFSSPFGTYYSVDTSILNDKGEIIDRNINSVASAVFKDCDLIEEGLYSRKITDKPEEGAIFLLRAFFEVFDLKKVKLRFRTNNGEKFENSQYVLEDLIFEFNYFEYVSLMKNYSSDSFLKLSEKENLTSNKSKRSRRIRQSTKDKVWRRDEGKCVECGSNENLEFDHIIPFSKGGANTYRNIQLLCQNCNRSKSDKIG